LFESTDKAAYPINAMGISKAIWKKLLPSEILETTVCLTRYGNVMASRALDSFVFKTDKRE
jgi:UDP-glucose 4-epimerase